MTDETFPTDRANRIADAVETIERNVSQLRTHQQLSHDEYTRPGEQDRRDAVERKFVKLAEAMIDTASELCKQERETLPEQRKERIRILADENIIDESLAERLRAALGFRDVLAHTYGPIVNDDIVYEALQNDLERYVDFVETVDCYLNQDV
jgi:uncharacterized protein YutE (UPF0331/DUF86 family)